jgi:DHA3 family macrolide efflux protein-like MFS transporter
MAQAGAAAPSMFAVFRKRDFSLLWVAQLVSTIGSSLTDLAAGILVYSHTGSALNVGLVLMASALPSLLVGLVAGVFVDRFYRKYIMLASDFIRAGLVVAIPFAVDTWGIGALYVIVFLASTVKQFFEPANESILPDIASDEELAAANSFLAISSFGSTAVGFAAAGFLSTIDIHIPFYVDSVTFLFSALVVSLVRIGRLEVAETTGVRVVVTNLREGVGYLAGNDILRTTFLIGIPVFFSFGLWNVLLLPMAIKVFGATNFEYGLQEGLTSLAFVAASLLMAKYTERLREGQWIVIGLLLMGLSGIGYGLSPNIWIGLIFVGVSGFMNAPMSVASRLLVQRNTPREMRGRVFSARAVGRDVVFLVGMVTAGIVDLGVDVRLLVVLASLILVATAFGTQRVPGLGQPGSEWRRTMTLLRTAPSAAIATATRAATQADLDELIRMLPQLGALDARRRGDFLARATVVDAPAGTAVVKVGEAGESAYFVLSGKAVAGVPTEDGGYRSLSAMHPGDFFGEIAALTGSRRTANVVADEDTSLLQVSAAALRAVMDIPDLSSLILTKLNERLTRTTAADLPRFTGADQRDLRDLRRSRTQALPKTYAEAGTGES